MPTNICQMRQLIIFPHIAYCEKSCTIRRENATGIRKQSASGSQKYSYQKAKPVVSVYEFKCFSFIHSLHSLIKPKLVT
jgi:hypothetical protein